MGWWWRSIVSKRPQNQVLEELRAFDLDSERDLQLLSIKRIYVMEKRTVNPIFVVSLELMHLFANSIFGLSTTIVIMLPNVISMTITLTEIQNPSNS